MVSLTIVAICQACATAHPAPDPNVNFAAHRGLRGIVVDRMAGNQPASLVGAPSSGVGGPAYLLEVDGRPAAALWKTASDQIVVRQTVDPSGPVIGRVSATTDRGAIRLEFDTTNRPSVYTSAFDRDDVHSEPNQLGSTMLSVHDLPGVYRAELKDAANVDVGWLRVRLGEDMAASRLYDGVLPARLNGPMAAAAVVLLESEIGDVEQSALDTWWSD